MKILFVLTSLENERDKSFIRFIYYRNGIGSTLDRNNFPSVMPKHGLA